MSLIFKYQYNKKKLRKTCLTVALLALLTSCFSSVYAAFSEDLGSANKISSGLKSRMMTAAFKEKIPVIIVLSERDADPGDVGGEFDLKDRYSLINAVSGESTALGIERLKESGKIKGIYHDHLMKLLPVEDEEISIKSVNNDAIGATYTQDVLDYTGRDVTIAVLDTGIDYTHADLGGCLGTGCRVKAGYDFVNGDSNPMDDEGHGTHCAGIAAANGGTKGVAPDADLLAVKVCSPEGCLDSDTIAGIDWAVSQGADVITLSLGSSEQPNDGYEPLEMICDAAIEAGVVIVAAAGNEGPGTGTMADVASTENVIAIGASNCAGTSRITDDTVASFSCRGPSAFGRFDPDLLAPGVDIYSTCIGGGYCTKSGTSMATPHAAGAAALLLEYDGTLSPAEVKSLLVHTAGDITGHPFEKGTGVMNVSRAILSEFKASINDADAWEETIIAGMNSTAVLRITNTGTALKAFTISITSASDAEGDSTIAASSFQFNSTACVAGGGVGVVEIRFVGDESMKPGTYGAILMVSSSSETARIPVALTIPLSGSGSIRGSVDDECSSGSPLSCGIDPISAVDEWGDWKFYKIMNINGTSFEVTLSWSGVSSDLDMYLFAPNGALVDVSGAGDTESEYIAVANPAYHEYWVAVYAYAIASTSLDFDLTVSYASTISIEPAKYQGSASKGEEKQISFKIKNDATTDYGLELDVVSFENTKNKKVTGTIVNTGAGHYSIVWRTSTSGMDFSDTRYMNASLEWSNPTKDLNMYLAYKNGSTWYTTRFGATHRSDLLGVGREELTGVDIRHYLETYDDFGVGIENPGSSQSYTLKMNFTDEYTVDHATVSPASIASLGANSESSVQVTVDTGTLSPGTTYDYYFIVQKSGTEVARAPVRLSIVEQTTSTSTTSTSTTSTSVPATTSSSTTSSSTSSTASASTTSSSSTSTTVSSVCQLTGDNPPCGEVTLSEVIGLINLWSTGDASLADVISLINAWSA